MDMLESCVCPLVAILGLMLALGLMSSYFSNQAENDKERARVNKINARSSEWGIELCQNIIKKEVRLGMTEEMVKLSWGSPTSIGPNEKTSKYQKTRWVYGVPRKGARYVWFTNGEVSKIREE